MEIVGSHWIEVCKENNIPHKFSFYIASLFFFLVALNGLGFLLYVFPVTTHFFFTLLFAVSIYIYFILCSIYKFRSNFFANFFPSGAPLGLSTLLVFIEIISNLCRPVALGLRIAANLSAGHILFAVLGDFGSQLLYVSFFVSSFTVYIMIFMVILELGVLVIQAYVFCLLIIIYGKDVIELH